MAIAGSALNSVKLRAAGNVLYEGQIIMRGADVVETDVDRCVARLRNGETVNLELHGDNLPQVRRKIRGDSENK